MAIKVVPNRPVSLHLQDVRRMSPKEAFEEVFERVKKEILPDGKIPRGTQTRIIKEVEEETGIRVANATLSGKLMEFRANLLGVEILRAPRKPKQKSPTQKVPSLEPCFEPSAKKRKTSSQSQNLQDAGFSKLFPSVTPQEADALNQIVDALNVKDRQDRAEWERSLGRVVI